QRSVDPGLTDKRPVEPEVLPLLPRDGVVEHAPGGARHRVHPDEERGIATLLEELRVLRPLLLDDVFATRIKQVWNERVERPALPGAVTVHDDDLGRTGGPRAAHCRVGL